MTLNFAFYEFLAFFRIFLNILHVFMVIRD